MKKGASYVCAHLQQFASELLFPDNSEAKINE